MCSRFGSPRLLIGVDRSRDGVRVDGVSGVRVGRVGVVGRAEEDHNRERERDHPHQGPKVAVDPMPIHEEQRTHRCLSYPFHGP